MWIKCLSHKSWRKVVVPPGGALLKKRKGKQKKAGLLSPSRARVSEGRVGILNRAVVSRKTYSFRATTSPSPILHLSWSWEGCPSGTKGDVGTRALTLLAVKEIGATLMPRTQAKGLLFSFQPCAGKGT